MIFQTYNINRKVFLFLTLCISFQGVFAMGGPGATGSFKEIINTEQEETELLAPKIFHADFQQLPVELKLDILYKILTSLNPTKDLQTSNQIKLFLQKLYHPVLSKKDRVRILAHLIKIGFLASPQQRKTFDSVHPKTFQAQQIYKKIRPDFAQAFILAHNLLQLDPEQVNKSLNIFLPLLFDPLLTIDDRIKILNNLFSKGFLAGPSKVESFNNKLANFQNEKWYTLIKPLFSKVFIQQHNLFNLDPEQVNKHLNDFFPLLYNPLLTTGTTIKILSNLFKKDFLSTPKQIKNFINYFNTPQKQGLLKLIFPLFEKAYFLTFGKPLNFEKYFPGTFVRLRGYKWSKRWGNTIQDLFDAGIQPTIKNGSLDLSNLNIGSLNGIENYDLPNITELMLSNNKLFTISPKLFTRFVNLKSLILDGNRITTIDPELFKHLKQLTRLDLSRNRITEIPEGLLNNLKNLKILFLQGNQIAKLPANALTGLKNLTIIIDANVTRTKKLENLLKKNNINLMSYEQFIKSRGI